ncbi:hypothetical protein D3C73_986000 [compost metagenome]
MNLVNVIQSDGWTARKFCSPTVFPIINDGDLCICASIQQFIRQLAKLATKLCAFPEYPCMLMAHMLDHSTMILFTCPDGTTQLEKQNCIRTACYCLIAPQTHDSRTLQGIIGLPILLTRCLLHQHERLTALETAHKIMRHGCKAYRRVQ